MVSGDFLEYFFKNVKPLIIFKIIFFIIQLPFWLIINHIQNSLYSKLSSKIYTFPITARSENVVMGKLFMN